MVTVSPLFDSSGRASLRPTLRVLFLGHHRLDLVAEAGQHPALGHVHRPRRQAQLRPNLLRRAAVHGRAPERLPRRGRELAADVRLSGTKERQQGEAGCGNRTAVIAGMRAVLAAAAGPLPQPATDTSDTPLVLKATVGASPQRGAKE